MGKKVKQSFSPLPSPVSSPKRPPFKSSSSPSPSSSSSSSILLFSSGIVLGVVIAVAVVVTFFIPSSSSNSIPTIDGLKKDLEELSYLRQQGRSISDKLAAAAFYESSLAEFSAKYSKTPQVLETLGFASFLDEAGDSLHRAKFFEKSEALHRKSLGIKASKSNRAEVSANDLVYSFVALATDLFSQGKTTEALDHTQRAQAMVPQLHAQVRANVASTISRLESSIFECEGDFVSALHRFEHALSIQPKVHEDKKERLHTHRDLLQKVLAYHSVPDDVASKMTERMKKVEKELMSLGNWTSPLQLPKVFLSNLSSKPWHDINDYPQLKEGYEIILKSFPSIRDEYFQLNSKSLLTQQGECIHDKNRGKWAVHDITSYWVPKDKEGKRGKEIKEGKEEFGCSVHAPSACKMFQELRDIGFPVIRGGYSAIAPDAWIRPHFGVTNGQLKFHLGVIIPQKKKESDESGESERCAFMRVGEEIRGWEEGKITFFDDSYVHEVWNNCTSERVVFQVVFVHPDLPPSSSYQKLFNLHSH